MRNESVEMTAVLAMLCPLNNFCSYSSCPDRTAHVATPLFCPGMLHLQAMAWHVTGDDRYASKVLQIVDAHASTNKEWGLRHENGPLVRYPEV
jgi:hypothetical protein